MFKGRRNQDKKAVKGIVGLAAVGAVAAGVGAALKNKKKKEEAEAEIKEETKEEE